ncbi:acyl-CoA synthetase family member 2, mitochondrial-like isoform X3 [Stylophora pistillata]|uniref:acyl-CoA synthetase family member 2, mitochondrial-like isoform X3 n=1 Tax=Stylophora pistillata TaxID=50429 RepID=UPI000C04E251|nr:acyl-CoA synthetase family member 2, mitochondrial-like isoform X3 [Stylophora pistillata]
MMAAISTRGPGILNSAAKCNHLRFYFQWMQRFSKPVSCGFCRRVRYSSTSSHEKLQFSYCQGISSKPFIGETIGQRLDKTVEKFPDREAYVCCEDNKRATFAEFQGEVDRLAAGLLAMGFKKGDRVGIWGPNMREWVITQFATAKAGLILVNINPAYQTPEVEYALKKVGCKAIIMADSFKTQDYYNMLTHIVHELPQSKPGNLFNNRVPDLKLVVMACKDHQRTFSGTMSFQELMESGGTEERRKLVELQNELQCDDPINIQFTSGTTGNPKGAILSHHSILNNSYYVGEVLEYENQYSRICIPVPLYHCFGMVLGSLMSATYGTTSVYPSRGFDAGAVLTAIQQEKCNSLYGTPTMFIDVLNHPALEKFDVSSLRTGKKVVIRSFNTICYGLTETSPVTTQTLMDDPIDLRVSTIGRVHPNNEVKIVDSDDRVVPVNSAGEICFRGYNVMLGYWDDKEKTDACIDPSGWFHSGDLATMDENGYIKVIGRIKDLIIRGGENIYPTEVEQFLYTHPKIQDVQVIGVPDPRLGEEVCAWIKLHAGETATPEEIKEFCKGQISHFKIPRYIKFADEFPLTVTGKVKKFVMRERTKEELNL